LLKAVTMNITVFGVVTLCMKCDQKFLDWLIEYTTAVLRCTELICSGCVIFCWFQNSSM